MILLVSYDLRSHKDYAPFYEALKQQGTWWHYLTSTWLISTTKTPQEVFESVRLLIAHLDALLIVEVGNRYSGWLPKEAWDWINSQRSDEHLHDAAIGLRSVGENLRSTAYLCQHRDEIAEAFRKMSDIQRQNETALAEALRKVSELQRQNQKALAEALQKISDIQRQRATTIAEMLRKAAPPSVPKPTQLPPEAPTTEPPKSLSEEIARKMLPPEAPTTEPPSL